MTNQNEMPDKAWLREDGYWVDHDRYADVGYGMPYHHDRVVQKLQSERDLLARGICSIANAHRCQYEDLTAVKEARRIVRGE